MSNRVVASVRKNAREEIRVSFEEYHGDDVAQIRFWFEAKDGSTRPSQNGIKVKLTLLPALASALRKAVNEAKAEGLIEAEPPYAGHREDTRCARVP